MTPISDHSLTACWLEMPGAPQGGKHLFEEIFSAGPGKDGNTFRKVGKILGRHAGPDAGEEKGKFFRRGVVQNDLTRLRGGKKRIQLQNAAGIPEGTPLLAAVGGSGVRPPLFEPVGRKDGGNEHLFQQGTHLFRTQGPYGVSGKHLPAEGGVLQGRLRRGNEIGHFDVLFEEKAPGKGRGHGNGDHAVGGKGVHRDSGHDLVQIDHSAPALGFGLEDIGVRTQFLQFADPCGNGIHGYSRIPCPDGLGHCAAGNVGGQKTAGGVIERRPEGGSIQYGKFRKGKTHFRLLVGTAHGVVPFLKEGIEVFGSPLEDLVFTVPDPGKQFLHGGLVVLLHGRHDEIVQKSLFLNHRPSPSP